MKTKTFKAYYFTTSEHDSNDATGLESFELHSLFVPERSILLSFVKWPDNCFLVIDYTQAIPVAKEMIAGTSRRRFKIISTFDVSADDISDLNEMIERSHYPQSTEQYVVKLKQVETIPPEPDQMILNILNGKIVEEYIEPKEEETTKLNSSKIIIIIIVIALILWWCFI